VGEAIWLYVYLLSNAMRTGHILRDRERLCRDLGIDESTLDTWIRGLTGNELVKVRARGSCLVFKLTLWPIESLTEGQDTSDSRLDKAVQSNVPVGSSLLLPASKAGKASKPGVDGGLGEGEGLLAEAQAVLAVSDLEPLRRLLAGQSEARIRDALARVSRTPPTQIRKSRFALFRHILLTSAT
jgi:hypothetical protein